MYGMFFPGRNFVYGLKTFPLKNLVFSSTGFNAQIEMESEVHCSGCFSMHCEEHYHLVSLLFRC